MKTYQNFSGATFSDCEKYRYALWRIWDDSREKLNFIMLNPSTADHEKNDPTITRCIDFAKRWRFGGVYITNLFAYRATNPADMMIMGQDAIEEPGSTFNQYHLMKFAKQSGKVVCAWGVHGEFLQRDTAVIKMLREHLYGSNIHELLCFGKNQNGTPKHPLYLLLDTQAEPFEYI